MTGPLDRMAQQMEMLTQKVVYIQVVCPQRSQIAGFDNVNESPDCGRGFFIVAGTVAGHGSSSYEQGSTITCAASANMIDVLPVTCWTKRPLHSCQVF